MDWKRILLFNISFIFVSLLVCEVLIFKFVIIQCAWQTPPNNSLIQRVIFVSDTHLLGPYHGHWFDKLRREWQMRVSFQTAFQYLEPDAVFLLGDVFDEGNLVKKEEWYEYVRRFKEIFYVDHGYPNFKVIVGNHDIGFHHEVLSDEEKWNWFKNDFKAERKVEKIILGHVRFITINSMAMKFDRNCSFCDEARQELIELSKITKHTETATVCVKNDDDESVRCKTNKNAVVLQHIPLYRKDEMMCSGPDEPPEKHIENIEDKDVLSKTSTKFLLDTLNPALVISGHTHFGCFIQHGRSWEYSVPSFSWRNLNNPSLVLGTFEDDEISLKKCFLPQESTVILLYIVLVIMLFMFNVYRLYRCRYRCRKKKLDMGKIH